MREIRLDTLFRGTGEYLRDATHAYLQHRDDFVVVDDKGRKVCLTGEFIETVGEYNLNHYKSGSVALQKAICRAFDEAHAGNPARLKARGWSTPGISSVATLKPLEVA